MHLLILIQLDTAFVLLFGHLSKVADYWTLWTLLYHVHQIVPLPGNYTDQLVLTSTHF